MCGITGIIRFDGQKIERSDFQAFNDSLSHRGPDYGASFFEESAGFALGHRRLSIIDLDPRSHQPMQSSDGRYVISFNGEIYNYLELRQELLQLGYQFFSESDTEVLLNAFKHWGPECMHKLNGMWAYAIWDKQEQALFVARDRFGVKPLYFISTPEFFAFASEQKALAHLPGFDLKLCADMCAISIANKGLIESFRNGIYQQVSKLHAGEYLTLNRAGTLGIHRWWNTEDELHNNPYQQCSVEELVELFFQSCKLRARADVKLASSLSGGLDSSSVTSALAHNSQTITPFVGCFPESELDESDYANMVIEEYGLTAKHVQIDEDLAHKVLLDAVFHSEDILPQPAIGPWCIYQAQKEHGFKVSLEGHGGDELLAGYYTHAKSFIADRLSLKNEPQQLAHAIVACSDMLKSFGNYRSGQVKEHILNALSVATPVKVPPAILGLKHSITGVKDKALEYVARQLPGSTNLQQRLFWDFHYGCLQANLRDFDKLSMGCSIEVRSPFMDWRFVLACFAASEKLKFWNGQSKRLIREHFTFVPSPVRQRKTKLGFNNPFSTWASGKLKPVILDMVHDRAFLEQGIVQGKVVRDNIEKAYRQGNTAEIAASWPLLNLYILQQRICKGGQ